VTGVAEELEIQRQTKPSEIPAHTSLLYLDRAILDSDRQGQSCAPKLAT
jgi:hypothetical protein